ncbi:anti-sigma factor [Chloroflexota bacterium]
MSTPSNEAQMTIPENSQPEQSGSLKRTYLYLGVLLAIVLLVMGVVLVMQADRNESARLYFSLEGNPAVQRYPVQPGEEGPAAAGELLAAPNANPNVGYVALAISGLPIIEPEETFQVWAQLVDGTMQRGVMFEPDSGGITYVTMPLTAPLVDYAGFEVSREPFGGSPTEDVPSGPLVLVATMGDS